MSDPKKPDPDAPDDQDSIETSKTADPEVLKEPAQGPAVDPGPEEDPADDAETPRTDAPAEGETLEDDTPASGDTPAQDDAPAKTGEVLDPDPAPHADGATEPESGKPADAATPWGKPDAQADAAETERAEADRSESAPYAPPAPLPPPQAEKRSIVLPLIFGGIVAAGIGYVAGAADLIGLGGPSVGPVEISRIDQELSAQDTRDAALEDRIAALEGTEPAAAFDPAPLEALAADLEALTARVAALEEAPTQAGTGVSAAALRSVEDRVTEQQAQIDALLGDLETARSAAADNANATLARAALAQLSTALDTGAAFEEPLAELRAARDVDIPAPLTEAAPTGVTPLSDLQATIPDAARAALAAARSADPEGTDGFGDFLRRQLGARSVVPREGADPDAVLSRVEAATRSGDLQTALAEADALPAAAQDAMADWLDAARTRAEALAAADALAQSVAAD